MNLSTIVWRDIHSLSAWSSLEDCKKWAEHTWNTPCVTVGFILEKNKKYILVAATHDGASKADYNDISLIPLSCVVKIINGKAQKKRR